MIIHRYEFFFVFHFKAAIEPFLFYKVEFDLFYAIFASFCQICYHMDIEGIFNNKETESEENKQ